MRILNAMLFSNESVIFRLPPDITYHLLSILQNQQETSTINIVDLMERKEKLVDDPSVVQELLMKDLITPNSIGNFAEYGCIKIVQELHKQVPSMNDYEQAFTLSIAYGHIEIIEYLLFLKKNNLIDYYVNAEDIDEKKILTHVIGWCSLKTLQHVLDKSYSTITPEIYDDIMNDAIIMGKSDMIRYLLDTDKIGVDRCSTWNHIYRAVMVDSLVSLSVLAEYAEIDAACAKIAARYGSQNIIEWTLDMYGGNETTIRELISIAASYDQYHIIDYLNNYLNDRPNNHSRN